MKKVKFDETNADYCCFVVTGLHFPDSRAMLRKETGLERPIYLFWFYIDNNRNRYLPLGIFGYIIHTFSFPIMNEF